MSASNNKAFVQKPAPAFDLPAVLPSLEIANVSLKQYAGKYLVLFFYPYDFTFVCPTEICAYSDRSDEFRAINCEVVAASCDSVQSHFAWMSQSRADGGLAGMKIPIIADFGKTMASDYGVLLEEGAPLRGLFIIAPNGIIRHITMNDLPVGRSVDETLRLVKAFQYTDVHGEVCPAGWTPGNDTIIPQQQQKTKYFAKHH